AALRAHHWPGNVRELKNLVESVIVMEKGRSVNSTTLRKYLPAEHIHIDRNLPVPLNRSSEELEREFIYRALIDMKAEIAQLREILLGKYIMPPRRLGPGVPVEPVNYDLVNPETRSSENEEDELPTLEEMEKDLIYRALEKSGGNKRKAAQKLGISERTLYRKIKEFSLPF
ncbi:MAG: sigma-54-dependent Fis family transcriptional regulator, partial [Calditrichaeota bacterium]